MAAERRSTLPREPLIHGEVTGRVLGAFFEAHGTLGNGFLESVYRAAMAIEMGLRDIPFVSEPDCVVDYKGHAIRTFRPDFIVGEAVVVEIKAVPDLIDYHRAQLLNYLRATGFEVGLLLNFGPKPQFQRYIRGQRREPDSRPFASNR